MKLNFQTILIAVFVLFAVLGFILFSRSSNNANQSTGSVVIWGMLPDTVMNPIAEAASTKTLLVSYVQKQPATFERELLEALAAGTGPDLFIVSQDDALRYQKFIYQIPYQSVSRRTYQSTFIDEANIFLTNQGIIALPFIVDPMVMYFNRAMLSSAFVTNPPQYWDEMIPFAQRITRKTESGAITQSAVGLGTSTNINHAKEIIASLVLQTGNPLVSTDQNGRLEAVLAGTSVTGVNPGESAIRFFTSFADSAKENYTWNPSLPSSDQMFSNGDLALYFGFASELASIRARNANLNYDVTLLPQTRNSPVRATYGKMYGLAVSKGSKNITGALSIAGLLSGKDAVSLISNELVLPAVRRDLLEGQGSDATYIGVFNNSAIIAQGFLDPDSQQSRAVFGRMIDSVNSRIADPYQAVQRGINDLNSLLSQYNQQ